MKIDRILFPAAAAGVLAADQIIKKKVCERIPIGKRIPMGQKKSLPGAGRIVLTNTENRGFALNRCDEHPEAVRAVSAAITAGCGILYAELLKRDDDPVTALGMSLLMGGALSNTADRLLRGKVVDYVMLEDGKAIYNLADFAIFAGTALGIIGAVLSGDNTQHSI